MLPVSDYVGCPFIHASTPLCSVETPRRLFGQYAVPRRVGGCVRGGAPRRRPPLLLFRVGRRAAPLLCAEGGVRAGARCAIGVRVARARRGRALRRGVHSVRCGGRGGGRLASRLSRWTSHAFAETPRPWVRGRGLSLRLDVGIVTTRPLMECQDIPSWSVHGV
jgi:hypothetical protein